MLCDEPWVPELDLSMRENIIALERPHVMLTDKHVDASFMFLVTPPSGYPVFSDTQTSWFPMTVQIILLRIGTHLCTAMQISTHAHSITFCSTVYYQVSVFLYRRIISSCSSRISW